MEERQRHCPCGYSWIRRRRVIKKPEGCPKCGKKLEPKKVGRPAGAGGGSMMVSFSLALDLKKAVDQMAEKAGLTRSGWVQMAIQNELKGRSDTKAFSASVVAESASSKKVADALALLKSIPLASTLYYQGRERASSINPFDTWETNIPTSRAHGNVFVTTPGHNPFSE